MSSYIDKDHYESIMFEHDFQRSSIEKALEIVKKYIIMNKLLLVGGMAIDLSLRSKGSQLYPDNKLPDYDFLSSNFHIDAYRIGEILTEANITGISVIRGLHASTMRVRVNFVPVADVTYVPKNIFDAIDTVNYMGFTIVHPHYQMIDQHRSLSLPYENAPMETVMQRWDKDMKRNDLLYNSFPIEETAIIDFNEIEITKELLKNECIGGYLAYNYWYQYCIDLGYKEDKSDKLVPIDFTKDIIKANIPTELLATVLSDSVESLVKLFKYTEKTKYNSVLDKIPVRVVLDNKYEILDNNGRFTSAYYDESHGFYVANLQAIMCHMLTLFNIYKCKNTLAVFSLCRKLVMFGCKKYLETNDSKYELLLPVVDIFGKHNYTESNELAYQDFDLQLSKKEAANLTPKNAYPEKGKPVKKELFEFDPTKSAIYQQDGTRSEL